MGIMAYSFLWVMQDLYHQPYEPLQSRRTLNPLGFIASLRHMVALGVAGVHVLNTAHWPQVKVQGHEIPKPQTPKP